MLEVEETKEREGDTTDDGDAEVVVETRERHIIVREGITGKVNLLFELVCGNVLFEQLGRKISPYLKWYHLLVFFSLLNLVNYMDRGAIAGVLPAVTKTFQLSEIEKGALSSIFMFGYMLLSPIFAHLSNTVKPTYLMSFGLSMWIISALATALAPSYGFLFFARVISGIGEASYASLAPTYIDDISPPKHKTLCLGLFFGGLPMGYALGYGGAGFFSNGLSLDPAVADPSTPSSWRHMFLLEALLMVPFATLCIIIPSSSKFSGDGKERHAQIEGQSMISALSQLLSNGRYIIVVLGYSVVTFVMGALAYWSPEYLASEMGLEPNWANYAIGFITVITGLFGTCLGGVLVDYLGGSGSGSAADFQNIYKGGSSAITITSHVVWVLSAFAVPISLIAFLSDKSSLTVFWIMMFLAELLFFATQSPINSLTLHIVPSHLRSLAMSCQIFFIHLLGDFPSPFIVGLIAEYYGLRYGMLFVATYNLFGVFWFVVLSLLSISHDVNIRRHQYAVTAETEAENAANDAILSNTVNLESSGE